MILTQFSNRCSKFSNLFLCSIISIHVWKFSLISFLQACFRSSGYNPIESAEWCQFQLLLEIILKFYRGIDPFFVKFCHCLNCKFGLNTKWWWMYGRSIPFHVTILYIWKVERGKEKEKVKILSFAKVVQL